jgi:RNA polymerase sigma factor (sigma-70 family)
MQLMAGVAAQFPQARVPAPALRMLGDDRLFRLASAGDSRAFEVIYERHHQALYRYCRSIVGNAEDAADALQSAMASALRGLVGEQREIAPRPWLFRIAHNESISLLRKRHPHATIDDALELEAPAHDPAVAQRLRDLVADLRELPESQRGALVMHELSGLPYREVATALDTTEPHARQLVYEARTALHDLAEGRAMECETVRRTISDGDRRVLRGRRIRSHLRTCSGCAGFAGLMQTRKHDLAAIAPPLPAAVAIGVLHNILGGTGSSATGAAVSSSGGMGLGTTLGGKALAVSAVSKVAAVVAITAAAGVGAVEIARTHTSHPAGVTPKVAPARSASPPAVRRSTSNSAAGSATPSSRSGASSGHRHSGSAPGHTKTGHPRHPAHPRRPIHRSHPTHPLKPSHPTTPARPAPSHGAPTGTAPRTTPTPSSDLPAGSNKPSATTTPVLPEETQTDARRGAGAKDLVGDTLAAP